MARWVKVLGRGNLLGGLLAVVGVWWVDPDVFYWGPNKVAGGVIEPID